MVNKMYKKDDINFEGISMQEGNKSSTLKLLVFMIITAVVLGLLIFTAGSFFAGNSENPDTPQITILPTSSESDPTSIPEPTESDEVTPTVTGKTTPAPSVTSSVVKQTLTVEVLNGSGVKGAASSMTSVLKNAGYTIVRTGNADTFTYTGVTINIKKSKASSLNQLKKDLSASDYLVTTSTNTYPESSTADAVIILGSEE